MADILLVEDDDTLGMTLEIAFADAGHEVVWRRTLASARHSMAGRQFDLLVLDLGLPDGDGMTLCKELRDSGNITPVLVLTARSTTQARVLGLEAGADDYLTKPFELPELKARITALLRRQGWHRPGRKVRVGALDVDFDRREARRDGQPIELTDLELDLLRYFVDHDGEPVSREQLLRDVWKVAPTTRTRTVDVFVSRLRRRIEPNSDRPRVLVNVRGVGYRMRLQAGRDAGASE